MMLKLAWMATLMPAHTDLVQTPPEDRGMVSLRGGEVWYGTFKGIEQQHLKIQRTDAQTGVILLVPADEILELRLPGIERQETISRGLRDQNSEQRLASAQHFQEYWQSRLPYLGWLSRVERQFLADHIPDIIGLGQHWHALGYARLLQQQTPNTNEPWMDNLDFAVLEALQAAQLEEQALNLAHQLIERNPGHCQHGLPWYLIARHLTRQGSYNEALQMLKTPLFLGVGFEIPWFEPLHELALQLARRTRQRRLYNELSAINQGIHNNQGSNNGNE